MRRRIFDSKIESLYHETGFDKTNGYPYIVLKTGVPDSDAVFAYFYATNETAKQRWYSIKNNLYLEKKIQENMKASSVTVPLKIGFPLDDISELSVVALKDESSKRIFVCRITNAESLIYNYDKIIIKRHANDPNKKIGEIIHDIDRTPIFRTKTKETGIVSNEPYSYTNSKKIIEDDDDFSEIEKIKEIIEKEDSKLYNKKGDIIFISGKEPKDLSLSGITNKNNSHVRPAETKKAESDCFSFEDFRELLNSFKEKYDEFIEKGSFAISEPIRLPVKKGKKRLNNKESYDGKNIREYITAGFVFKGEKSDKNVLLIELDQKYSGKGFSTYILVGEKNSMAGQEIEFLKRYLLNNNLDNIENYFKMQDIIFIRKKHPDIGNKDKKDKSFKAWGEDLYKKLKKN
jgi:hypothetical protein